MNNDLELKGKRIETAAKLVGFGVVAFFVAPVIVLTIKGMIGLLVAGAIGLVAWNVGVPWFAIKMRNWRLKALKYEASLNPIETLENQYSDRATALNKIRDNLKEFYSVVQELASQIKEHNQQYPNRPSQFQEKYQKMMQLYSLRAAKYKQASKKLEEFSQLIDEKRSDWKVAQSAAKALKLANVGEDFQSKLMADTAFSTINDGLNFAFSELEVSLLDEPTTPVQQAALPAGKQTLAIEDKKSHVLDMEFDLAEAAYIPRNNAA